MMSLKQNFYWFMLFLMLQLFRISIASCPLGCMCPDTSSAVCNHISVFPNLTPDSYITKKLTFIDCEFSDGIMPQIPPSYANITSLSLQNCTRVIGDEVFNFASMLQNLTITRNYPLNISSPAPFKAVPMLGILDLSNNEMSTLPEELCSGTPHLMNVNVSHNRLDRISKTTFSNCRNYLEEISLQDNDFESLSYDVLPWFNLHNFNLSNNPWRCDCAMLWVKEFQRYRFADVRCKSPSERVNEELYEVENRIRCGSGEAPIALGIGIPILIFCLIVIGYYLSKITRSHKKRNKLRSSVKYSSVYGETVESSSKQVILA